MTTDKIKITSYKRRTVELETAGRVPTLVEVQELVAAAQKEDFAQDSKFSCVRRHRSAHGGVVIAFVEGDPDFPPGTKPVAHRGDRVTVDDGYSGTINLTVDGPATIRQISEDLAVRRHGAHDRL